jgi:hypothetical protein
VRSPIRPRHGAEPRCHRECRRHAQARRREHVCLRPRRGQIEDVIAALALPVSYVTPLMWRKALACHASRMARTCWQTSYCRAMPSAGGARSTTGEPRRRWARHHEGVRIEGKKGEPESRAKPEPVAAEGRATPPMCFSSGTCAGVKTGAAYCGCPNSD